MSFGMTEVLALLAASDLAKVGTVHLSSRNLEANDSPPRFVFERGRIIELTTRNESVSRRDPPSNGADEHTLFCTMWGETEEDCDRMRQALCQVLRDTLSIGNFTMETADWVTGNNDNGSLSWQNYGCVLRQEISIILELPGAALPDTLVSPFVAPSASVSNLDYTTSTLASFALDGTGATTGDGILQGGEVP